MKNITFLDKICIKIDHALRAVSHLSEDSGRPDPDQEVSDVVLTDAERKISAGLMRVNHSGEVCAQALYLGQGLTARLPKVRDQMMQAAKEEADHLKWCKRRIDDMQSHTSYLNPLWFIGAFSIGAVAGLVGDAWSLGFVAETEAQVAAHLKSHITRLPIADKKSEAILNQMYLDESHHRQMAIDAGAAVFSPWVKMTMRYASKVMTKTAYWI